MTLDELRALEVAEPDVGLRLDLFLTRSFEGHTRSCVRRWILEGRVEVDGAAVAKPGLGLRCGMHVIVRLPPPASPVAQPESIPLRVIHEDDHLIVVDKPAGLVIHPGHGCRSGTLVNALLGRGTPLAPAGGTQRPGIVHRLDRGTSGLVVVAKTDLAFHRLAAAFAGRKVHKRYLALVWGRPEPPAGVIERPIGRSRNHPIRMAVVGTRGRRRAARSEYRTLESLNGFALLEVLPRTGRTHQIRVHLQSLHHPIVGDERYGGRAWRGLQHPLRRKAVREFDRLALHAAGLELLHPIDGTELTLTSPLPAELVELFEALRRP